MSAGTVSRVAAPITETCGFYAGTDIPHLFAGATFCWWCFGGRDDPRHWLPPYQQAIEDDLVAEYEDLKPPPRNRPWMRRSPTPRRSP
jgi:hypothetical protein